MKRDVKVGLFVAAVVCGLAAVLLGGGLSAKAPGRVPALTLGGEAPGPVAVAPEEECSASVPADLTGGIEPPAEPGEETFDALAGTQEEAAADPAADLGAPAEEWEDFDWPAAETTDGALAAVDSSTDLFDAPDAPDVPDEPTGENPEDLFAAWPSAGDGPMPSPEDAEAEGTTDLEPAVPVGGEEVIDDATGAEETPAPRKRFYIVKDGESFWTITRKLYGAGKYYAAVVKANPDVDPRRVRAGQVIAVPAIEGAELREDFLATAEELEPRSRRPRVYLASDARHVIRSGETLGDIAQKHYKSAMKWPHILRANPTLDPKRLRAGKEITVPALTEPPGAPRLPDSPRPRPRRRARTPRVYLAEDVACVVEHGDTLEGISFKHYGVRHKWQHILRDSRNAGVNAKRLRPGDKIVVPALTE
ncbi:MAG: LysM peptidoglycan-binding domain-containing protein [Planctomycetota bacterium]|jgi:nucleoid-associated protein YgaU